MTDDRLHDEVERVGAGDTKAGAARYIFASDFDGDAWLLGPPNQHPRTTWRGATADALAALAAVPDDAGPDAVWEALA